MGHIFERDRLEDDRDTVEQVGYKILVSFCRIRKFLRCERRKGRYSWEMSRSYRVTPIGRRRFGEKIEYSAGLLARRRCQENVVASGRRKGVPETS